MFKVNNPTIIKESYTGYLSDESRLEGTPVSCIYYPETTADVCEAVNEIISRHERLTISGARTGIVGGAVPNGVENLISMEQLQFPPQIHYDGKWIAHVGAGMPLEQLQDALKSGDMVSPDGTQTQPVSNKKNLCYPVDPTERTAQIGGSVATNASGARSFFYGPTRAWVQALTVVLPSGKVVYLKRGDDVRVIHDAGIPQALLHQLKKISYPGTKHTAGYCYKEGMDVLDLFIGAEGTLGIITEIDLVLAQKPKNILMQIIYFQNETQLFSFLHAIDTDLRHETLSIEFFDVHALQLLKKKTSMNPVEVSYSSAIPEDSSCALYIENIIKTENDLERLYEYYEHAFENVNIPSNYSWAGCDKQTELKMKLFRHAVPEEINAIIGQRKIKSPGLRKIASDIAVPFICIEEMYNLYNSYLIEESLDYVVFGHIGDGHLHVNVLPHDAGDIERAQGIFKKFAAEAVKRKGSVSAEHGIGMMKKEFLPIQFNKNELETMMILKKTLDPDGRFNPGVLIDY